MFQLKKSKKMKFIISILLCCIGIAVFAQKKTPKPIEFVDGVYNTFMDFKNNSPKFPLHKIPNFDYKLDGEQNLLFLSDKSIAQLSESEIQSLDNIWGLCIKGKPYLKVQVPNKNNTIYFVRYHLIGKICYLYYPIFEDKTVEMFIHSPYSGAKVGKKTITNRERTLVQKMMLFETGEFQDFNPENFKNWIKDDERLLETIKEMSDKELEEKLFKTLKIYNDRNPIFSES